MRIVTSGSRYLDIDAYAGIIAYAELLQRQGQSAQAASAAPWNESIPAKVRAWISELLGVTFDGNVARADRMWLRKEIIKKDLAQ